MQHLRRTFLAWLGVAGLVGASLAPVPAAAQSAGWQQGPGAILDNTYIGFVDQPSANASVPMGGFTVSGWFVDQQAQGWAGADQVQVFQGTMDGGGKLLATGLVAQNRPDVAGATGNPFWAASGFSAAIPVDAMSIGTQTLSVYVHTAGKGWWFKQVQLNVTSQAAPPSVAAPAPAAAPSGAALPIIAIEKPKDGEQLNTHSGDYQIIGYALDKNAPSTVGVAGSGIDRVEVYIDAERDNGGTLLGDADLGFSDSAPASQYGDQFASAGWRLTFKPTNFHANTHLLYAYAHSAYSGKEDLAVRYFSIHE